jgi:hypothetical protein
MDEESHREIRPRDMLMNGTIGRKVTRFEVVVYSQKQDDGSYRTLADAAFDDYDNANMYLENFRKAVPYAGNSNIYHPGTERKE